MTSRRHITVYLAATIALAAAAPHALAAAGESARMAGAKGDLWVVIGDVEKTYRVIQRPAGKGWISLPIEGAGRPADIAADAGGATVFFADGESVRYVPPRAQPARGLTPDATLWPAGTVLLSATLADDGSPVILARRPTGGRPRPGGATAPSIGQDSGPAATPATGAAPAPHRVETVISAGDAEPAELVLLVRSAGAWVEKGVYPLPPVPRGGLSAELAELNGTDYVLLAQPRLLLAFRERQWRTIELPEALRQGRVLDLLTVQGQLVAVAFNHPAPGRISLAAWGQDRWGPVKPVVNKGEAVTWDEDAPPAAAPLGAEVALLWQHGPQREWMLAACDADGSLTRSPEAVAFRGDSTEQAEQAQFVFLLIVLGTVTVLIFWPGQPARTKPFSLPETLRPSFPLKRLVAAFIDLMPCSMLGLLIAGQPEIQPTVDNFRQYMHSAPAIYYFLISLGAFVVYCTVMEAVLGATVGKMIFRMRVVGDEGRRPTVREVALRNLFKVADLLFPPFLVVMVFTRYRQRMGDRIAWTAVVDPPIVPPPLPPGHEQGPPEAKDEQPDEGEEQEPPKL